ncbi:hypothetical protein LRP49_02750 [Enterovibrio sp. ZSDZ35]|uniref:Uncharacterized protein n=1 Tax=Enterovibrio qingdaonensis TaxID=2899818 RepID=A0ABT5QGX2_9GAMM|nr:hypothetical protein [Enterovibrio sp. ZSDZ35]MDD1780109.1 hypothetical protein [Enterovibrio sp. ZSDZ35]
MTVFPSVVSTSLLPMAHLRVISVVVLFLLTASCANDKASPVALEGVSQIEDDEILLIGELSVVPIPSTFSSNETDTLDLFAGERVLLWLDASLYNSVAGHEDLLGLTADWGEMFAYVVPKRNVRLTGLERATVDADDTPNFFALPLPENFAFLVRVDDRVVYIGHLRLYVDQFDQIVSFEVLDESRKVQRELRKRTMDHARFRVSLLAPESNFH